MCAGACLCTADTWCATAIIVAIPGAVVSATNKCSTALRIFAAKTLSFFAHGDCTVTGISTAITRFATAILRAIPGAVVLATNQCAIALKISAAGPLSFMAYCICAGACSAVAWISTAVPLREA